MVKVKHIVREEPVELELEINNFLEKIDKFYICKDIKYSTHFDSHSINDEYCAMIIYEEK